MTAKTPQQPTTNETKSVSKTEYETLKAGLIVDTKTEWHYRLSEVVPLSPVKDIKDEGEVRAKVSRAISMVDAIAPQDGVEELLAMQMVGLHQAAMQCAEAGIHPDMPDIRKDVNLAMMVKLTGAYAKHMAVLDKHRRRASQTVIVEHVNVESGGQAIVGHVETDAKKTKTS